MVVIVLFCQLPNERIVFLMFVSVNFPIISLTVIKADTGQKTGAVTIKASRLLSYEQRTGFTRLRVRGGECMDVREGTDEIDRRLRQAASQADSGR